MNSKLFKEMKTDISLSHSKQRFLLLSVLFIVALAVRLINFDNPLTQEIHSFRQTQTAITVQCYFNDGWSLLNYETPVFGSPWKVIFECPIYQSIVYAFMKISGVLNVDIGCRIISVFAFMLSAVMIYRFSVLITSEYSISTAIYILYLFLPYNLYWSRAALIDYTSVLFGLIYAYGLINWIYYGKNISYIIAMIFGVLAYLQKSTSMFPVIAFLAMVILKFYYDGFKKSRNNLKKYIFSIDYRRLISLMVLCIIPVAFGYLWVVYSDVSKASYYYTQGLTSSALKDWNHGTLLQKTSLNCWSTILDRLREFSCGAFALIVLTIVLNLSPYKKNNTFMLRLIVCVKKHIFLITANLVAVLFTIISLFNLYLVHNYYIIALTPYLCILTGIIIYDVIIIAVPRFKGISVSIAIVLTIVFGCFSGSENLLYLDCVFSESKEHQDVWNYIAGITSSDEKIIIEGHDWTSALAYKMNRKCFMLRGVEDDSYFAQHVFPYDNYAIILAEHPENLENTFAECGLAIGNLSFSSYLFEIYKNEIPDIIENANPALFENDRYTFNAERDDWIVFSRHAGDSRKYSITVTLSDGSKRGCSIFFSEGAETAVYSPKELGEITAVYCGDEITGVSVYKPNQKK